MADYLNSRSNQFLTCHVCGAEVPRQRKACQDCGADESTGLHGDDSGAVAGIADDSGYSYDDFIRREFGSGSGKFKPAHLSWFYWIVGILCLLGFIWLSVP